MMAIILWAHRQRLSESQTHKAPAAAVPCVGGDRREQPTINAPRPSPFARLRRTKPPLTKDYLPNRLPMQRLSVSPCFFAAPMGYPVAAGGHRRQTAKSARQRRPNSLPTLCPPKAHKNKMRPAMPTQRQNTSTLRAASASVGSWLSSGLPTAAGGRCGNTCRPIGSDRLQATSRPCRKPSARPSTSPSGWLAVVGHHRKCGTAFARCASNGRRAPSLPAVVRPRPLVSEKAQGTKAQAKGKVVQ